MNIIIYHKNCADGFVAYCCARQWHENNDIDYLAIEAQYKEEDKYIPELYKILGMHKVDRVFVVDFSLLEDTIADLIARNIQVVIIDHHKSAKDRMGCFFNPSQMSLEFEFHFSEDNTKSGAALSADYFNVETDLKDLAYAISEYDTWLKRNGEDHADIIAEGIYAILGKYGTEAYWQMNVREVYAAGAPRIELRNARANNSIARKILCVPHYGPNIVGYAVNDSKDIASYVGHKLALLKGTFGIVYFQLDAITVECSIRSNDGKTALEIARAYSGGGHPDAAGFRISMYEFQKWLLVGDM